MDRFKMDKFKEIQALKKDEIKPYIERRLSELQNAEQKVIGLNTNTYVYNGLLDNKVRINNCDGIKLTEKEVHIDFGGITIDDPKMYEYVVEAAHEYKNPVFAVMTALDDYLDLRNPERLIQKELIDKEHDNLMRTVFGKEETISIQEMREFKLSRCSEIAGVAQNMLKFLGMDSDYIIGYRQNERVMHSYNLIYPWGRESDAILFDGTHNPSSVVSLFSLRKDVKTQLFSGETIELTEKDMIKAHKRLFGFTPETNTFKTQYTIFNPEYLEETGHDTISVSSHKLIFKRIEKEED